MEEELGHSKKRLQKSKYVDERQERCEQLDARIDSNADDF
jgi:hypothetical protein